MTVFYTTTLGSTYPAGLPASDSSSPATAYEFPTFRHTYLQSLNSKDLRSVAEPLNMRHA